MAAFLEREPESRKEAAIASVKSRGIEICPPDINKSGMLWEIDETGKNFIQPLTSVKGLGEKAVEQIVNNRPFNTVEELLFNENISYRALNKRCLDVLCRSHALDDLVDARFNNLKHFWKSVVDDRPKTQNKLLTNIEAHKEIETFTDPEDITNIVTLTGLYPLERVLTQEKVQLLIDNGIPALGDYDKENGVHWFIVKSAEQRKTRTKKPYLVLTTIDITYKNRVIKCWGYNPDEYEIQLNRLYVAKVKHDKWGFSINKLWKNMKCVG